MSKSTHLLFKKLGLLLALAFPACALPDDDGELQDEVSSTSQALGSSLTVGLARGASGLRDWGTDTVVFAGPQDGSGTTQLVTMFLSDGSTVTSSLGNTLKSAEADSEIYFIAGASLQKWGLLGNVFVAPVGVPKGRLGLSSSTVYWSDQNGIQKVSRTSNVVGPPVLAGANNRLIGVDGSVLYYVLENSNAHWLKKVNTNGTGETVNRIRISGL